MQAIPTRPFPRVILEAIYVPGSEDETTAYHTVNTAERYLHVLGSKCMIVQ